MLCPGGATVRIGRGEGVRVAVADTVAGEGVAVGVAVDVGVSVVRGAWGAPGGGTGAHRRVSNRGDRDSDGVVMYVGPEPLGNAGDFTVGGNYSNCDYGVGDQGAPGEDDNGVLCRFDSTVVTPGEVLVPSAPLPVSATATATQGIVAYGFDVSGGPLDKQTTKGHPGTGAPLTLVPVLASFFLGGSVSDKETPALRLMKRG